MKNKLLTLAGVLALLGVLGKFYARPVMAQVRAALVQDIDQPARAPFQASVQLTFGGTVQVPVSIPSGERLVVESVNVSGGGFSAGGGVQPVALLEAGVAGNPVVNYYFAPSESPLANDEFYGSWPAAIYADSLVIGMGYAGYVPNSLGLTVRISGHLIKP
jgi:hypothetical protein